MIKVQLGPEQDWICRKCGLAGMSVPHTEFTSSGEGTIIIIEVEICLGDLKKRNHFKKRVNYCLNKKFKLI